MHGGMKTERHGLAAPAETPPPGQRRPAWPKVRRWELLAMATIVGAFLAIGFSIITDRAPLGHDESVYAQRARFYATGDALGSYWADYRAPGLPALMRFAYAVRPSDGAIRAVPLLLAAAGVVLTWAWGRHLLGRTAGVLGAGLFAFTPGTMRYAWQISLDIPATTFALAAILIFSIASARDRLPPWVLAIIPIAGFAATIRFGAPVVVGAGLGVMTIARWRTLRRSLGLTIAALAGTAAGMIAVLTVPALTGAGVAPIRAFTSFRVAKGNPFGKSYREFAQVGPGLLGRFVGAIVVLGLVLAVVGLIRRALPRATLIPPAVFVLFVIGLGIALGQGAGNYLTPGLPFLHLGAAAGLAWALRRVPRSLGVAAVLAVAVVAGTLTRNEGARASDFLHAAFDRLRSAAVTVGARTEGRCTIVTSYAPQVGWYARCPALVFPGHLWRAEYRESPAILRTAISDLSDRIDALTPADGTAVLFLANRGKRQPSEAQLALLRSLTSGRLVTVGTPGAPPLRYITADELDRARAAAVS